MPDWRALVRSKLAGATLEDGDATDVVEEFAQHLEDRYAYLQSQGWSDEQAAALSLSEIDDEFVPRVTAALT